MSKIYLLLLFLAVNLYAFSEELIIKDFNEATMNLSASTNLELDLNDNPCALIIVYIAADNVTFSGNVVKAFLKNIGEYWVYMSAGSKRFTINAPGYVPIVDFTFGNYGVNALEGKITYKMIVDAPSLGEKKQVHTASATTSSSSSISIKGEYVIPDDIEIIQANAYKNQKELTSVVIGDHVREIEDGAFRGCSNLTTVTINSDEVVSKDYYSGPSLSDLFGPQVKTYIIGESVRGIGRNAFAKCYDLKKIVIPSSVREIGNKAFAECSKLTFVTLNSNEIVSKDFVGSLLGPATSTMEELFGAQVEEFVIGGDVREIGQHVFGHYKSMKKISLGDNIESIKAYAFEGCSGLTSVNLPKHLHQLGNYVFKNCTNLQSVTIPGSVESIGSNCFRNCSSLSSVKISEGIERIDNYAFYGCSELTSFRIPKSLTYLGMDIFDGCNSLTTIYIPKGKKYNSSQTYRSDCRIIRY